MLGTRQKFAWQVNEFDKPLIAAHYFGFIPIAPPRITDADLKAVEHCASHPYYDAAEKAALIRTYIEQDLAALPHPLALIYKRRKNNGYSLHYIGAPGAVAEATLIRAALSILSEEGHKNLRVDLNCIGDRDSMVIYERELLNHVKKFGVSLPPELRESLREDIFNLFTNESERAIELRSGAPTSLNFLSSAARSHFKELLEFIEGLGLEFGLAPELIGERNHASHTVFGIRLTGEEAEKAAEPNKFLAVGYRYSRLGKRFGLRKEVPMAGITIFSRESTKKTYRELPRSKFYLVQLGHEAKIRTLHLIEALRRERIPIQHFLGKDKLAVQLQGAEEARVNYLIIIGHKEALDATATIRNMQTRAQDTVPLSILPEYLKHIKL